MPAINRLWA